VHTIAHSAEGEYGAEPGRRFAPRRVAPNMAALLFEEDHGACSTCYRWAKGPEKHMTRARAFRCAAGVIAVALSVVFIGTGIADADGLGAGATPNFPVSVVVGDVGIPATIQVQNDSVPDTPMTVCNFGDALPCPAGDPGITLIPSCGQLGAFSSCAPGGADPGVFQVSAIAVGVAGACIGMPFAVTLIDPAFGQLRFTPQPPGITHIVLPTYGSFCRIGFTFDVLRVPTVDHNAGAPGQQTVQVLDNTQTDGVTTASGRGTSTGTTVLRVQPSIATVPSSPIALGAGQLADTATVSGRVNPQPGASIDFRAYGPNDATCSGPPAFQSLGLPYPVAGGAVTSAAFTPTAPGVYRWIATYSGDANNLPATGVCSDTTEWVTVTPATPSIATTPTPTITVGSGQLADSATVFGLVNPQPGASIDFRLYGPNNATCTGPPVFQSLSVPYPVTGGPVTSAAFTPTLAGVYRWIATYSGDANNVSVSGACSDASETVTVTPSGSQAPPGPGSFLPATGSPSGTLLFLAIGLSLTGFLLVGSTRVRRSSRTTA
jgi:hypothetical protein